MNQKYIKLLGISFVINWFINWFLPSLKQNYNPLYIPYVNINIPDFIQLIVNYYVLDIFNLSIYQNFLVDIATNNNNFIYNFIRLLLLDTIHTLL